MNRGAFPAAIVLACILAALFFPALFGGKTLLLSAWDVPSVMNNGAYDPAPIPPNRIARTSDPGAPAWQTEPWLKLIGDQLRDGTVPLWNPYSSYGTPLAAAMQPQPFFPLSTLVSLHLTPRSYDFYIVSRLLIGGLLMFLFARLFLSALPSLFAAIAFMLSGYFIIFLNMPHLSVEVLLPGLFLTFERILRNNSWTEVAGAAVLILLSTLGGMPESLLLGVAFASLYFVCRLVFAPEFRIRAAPLMLKFVAAIAFGFALAMFLLLPFVEFMQVAHDTHQPGNRSGAVAGLEVDGDTWSSALYLFPMLFGPILNSILTNFAGWSGLRGYWGVLPSFFALAAIVCWFFPRRIAWPSATRFLTAFFAIMLALMLLKRFGSPVINWIGVLPLFNMVTYVKYDEPLIALCVAMLGGIGFMLFAERRADPRYVLLAAAVTAGVMLLLAGRRFRAVLIAPQFASYYYLAILIGIALLLAAILIVAWLAVAQSPAVRRWMLPGVLVLLIFELGANFLAPSYYLFGSLAPASRSPYRGAPFIDFLHARNTDQSRVFAREGYLYPNWSAAFALSDARSLDALHYNRYIRFTRNFLLAPGDEYRARGDLADRFTGGDASYAFSTDTEKRFLALSSIKYLVSGSEYNWSSEVLDAIVAQHKGENLGAFGSDLFRIGASRSVLRGLLQHPPSPRVSYKVVIDPAKPVFEALAAIKAEAADKSDGAGFTLEVKSGDAIEPVFSAIVNPRDVPADRDGRKVRVDLSRYAGKEIELLFSTDPGPSGSNAWDWAGWVRPQFVSKEPIEEPTSFKPIYDDEVRVYEVPSVLPRAAVFHAVEIVPDAEVLARLKAPSFDPNNRVVLSREQISDAAQGAVEALAKAAPSPHAAATITQYRTQQVRIEAETAAPAVLMLTDAAYPGWRAYVNGERVPILTANYLFRGVLLPAGKSTVEFRYEPQSFRIGLGISALAFVGLAGLVVHERRRRRAVLLS